MGINVTKLLGFNQLPAARPVGVESGRAKASAFGSTNPIQNTRGLAARIEAAAPYEIETFDYMLEASAPYERSPETRNDVLGQKLYCLG